MKSFLRFTFAASLLISAVLAGSYDVTYKVIESSVPVEKQKTMIFMHGAGEKADYYIDLYNKGQFPKNDDVKIMFLQSHLKQRSRYPWMRTFSGYDNMDPDARNVTDGDQQCVSIDKIIRDEITNTYGHLSFAEGAKRIFISGKSQGALLSLYLQLMKLETPVGGVGVFSGFPIKPLYELTYSNVTKTEAREACSTLSQDMRFFIWHGTKDGIFNQEKTFSLYKKLFKKLGIKGTIKVMYAEKGLTHKTSKTEVEHFMKFIDDPAYTGDVSGWEVEISEEEEEEDTPETEDDIIQ